MNKAAFFGLVLGLASVASGQHEAKRPSTSNLVRQPPTPLEAALTVYAELTGKTILRASLLPPLRGFIADPLPANTNAAVALIESELRRNGIDMVLDGELFVRVMPAGWSNSPMAGFLATLKSPLPDNEAVAMGSMAWTQAGADQAVEIYAVLRSRTLIRPNNFNPCPRFKLRTQRAMTKDQASYAIAVLLGLNGLAALDDGDKFVQLVPVQSWSQN